MGEEEFEPSAASIVLPAAAAASATAPKDPAQFEKEVAFITGVKADGSIVTSPANYFERAHKWGATVAGVGATVTYADPAGQERTVTILGIDEADSALGQVSWISPVARALLKAREGDTVTLRTPGGIEELDVVRVHYGALDTDTERDTTQ